MWFFSLLLLLEQMCTFLITAKQVAMRYLKQQPTFINNIFSLFLGFFSHSALVVSCISSPDHNEPHTCALKYQY